MTHLDDVVAHGPAEEDVRTQAAVVATGQLLQLEPLPVAHHVELGEAHPGVHLPRQPGHVTPLLQSQLTWTEWRPSCQLNTRSAMV